MWTLWLSLAFAADPAEIARIHYLSGSRWGDEARVEARKLVEREPGDLGVQLVWMKVSAKDDDRARRLLVPTYEAWVAEAPDDPVRHAALGYAIALSVGEYGDEFGAPGPWCDAALAEIGAILPTEPGVRARVVSTRWRVLKACDRDRTAEDAELLALSELTPLALSIAVYASLGDEDVDEADADRISRMIDAHPWRIDEVARLWRDELHGAALERARGLVLERAISLSASDDPMVVDATIAVLRAAKRDAELEAAILRLSALDPDHQRVPSVPSKARTTEAKERDPARIGGDPEARLAALDAQKPDLRRWEVGDWHTSRAAVLDELGREREALAELRKAYVHSPGYASNFAFARATIAQDRWLRKGERAMTVVVDSYALSGRWNDDWEADGQAFAENLAEAHAVRAAVRHARGREDEAAEDAWASLLLDDTPEAHALLGLATADLQPSVAFEHLGLALARGGAQDAALDAEARAALESLWADQGGWAPGGLDGWLKIRAATLAPAGEAPKAKAHPRAGQPFPDLAITVGGATTTLSTLPGPLVVDMWATWCGPCVQALPHVDAVARKHDGITFVAVSVDDELATAVDYLSQSDTAFVQAWVGDDGMKLVGISGIPTTFVLDADHRIVDVLTGWGPGAEDRLEDALRALP